MKIHAPTSYKLGEDGRILVTGGSTATEDIKDIVVEYTVA